MPSILANTQSTRISRISATSDNHFLLHPQPHESNVIRAALEKGGGQGRHYRGCRTNDCASRSLKSSVVGTDSCERLPDMSKDSYLPWEQTRCHPSHAPCGSSPQKPSKTGLCSGRSLGMPHTRRPSPPATTPCWEEDDAARLHAREGNHGGI